MESEFPSDCNNVINDYVIKDDQLSLLQLRAYGGKQYDNKLNDLNKMICKKRQFYVKDLFTNLEKDSTYHPKYLYYLPYDKIMKEDEIKYGTVSCNIGEDHWLNHYLACNNNCLVYYGKKIIWRIYTR